MDRFDTRIYWVKLSSGHWVVAERRHSHRWFTCGNEFVKSVREGSWKKGEIIEVGEEIICPYRN